MIVKTLEVEWLYLGETVVQVDCGVIPQEGSIVGIVRKGKLWPFKTLQPVYQAADDSAILCVKVNLVPMVAEDSMLYRTTFLEPIKPPETNP